MPRKRKATRRPYGLGSITKRGDHYQVRWRENGLRRTASFPSRELAEKVLAKIAGDIALGRAGMPADPTDAAPLVELAGPWLARRDETHRAARDDRNRWDLHLEPFFGRFRPDEITPAHIRAFAESKVGRLSTTSVGHCVRLLSAFFSDLVERGLAALNPVKQVPRATRRLFKNAHDPKDTPFLERAEDIRRVFLHIHDKSEASAVAFAVGALAGLRVSEILGLDWAHVDLERRRIHVRQQARHGKLGSLKDGESRIVPILDSLLPILRNWKVATGGVGLMFRPACAARGGRPGRPPAFMRAQTVNAHLQRALASCGLVDKGLNLYRATRHTFASHWVMAGRPIHTLQAILGHESVTTTERYAHLRADTFSAADLAAVSVDLTLQPSKVLALSSGALGSTLGAEKSAGGGGRA